MEVRPMWPTLLFIAASAAALATGMREACLALATAGGLIHTLLLKPQAACLRGRRAGCEAVLASPYAAPLGIPLQYPAAAWFAGLLPAARLGLGAAWAALGLAAIAVFVALEARLRALCMYCTLAHLLGLLAAVALLTA